MGPLVAIVVRLIAPVFILKWPLGGMIASIIADSIDVVIVAAIRSDSFLNYTTTDKMLDTYMLTFAVFVSLHWENKIARFTSIALFLYRLVGVIVLLVTDTREVLFIFPNVFQLFFIYHLVTMKWFQHLWASQFIYHLVTMKWFQHLQVDGHRSLLLILLILLTVSLAQEYTLHIARFHPWVWLHTHTSQVRHQIYQYTSLAYTLTREILETHLGLPAEQLRQTSTPGP